MMQNKRKVLVTGGSRGIGKAIAQLLGTDWQVIAPTRQVLDLSDMSSIERYFESTQHKFDALVNNAGINIIKPTTEITHEDMRLINLINLEAPLTMTKHCLEHMKLSNFGKIVNVSSIWGQRSKELRALYSATKFGIIGQTKALSRELAPFNILVNAVCPGFTNTELTASSLTVGQLADIKQEIPCGRLAEPIEIAQLVAFLLSDENTYITGQAITIDGGFTA